MGVDADDQNENLNAERNMENEESSTPIASDSVSQSDLSSKLEKLGLNSSYDVDQSTFPSTNFSSQNPSQVENLQSNSEESNFYDFDAFQSYLTQDNTAKNETLEINVNNDNEFATPGEFKDVLLTLKEEEEEEIPSNEESQENHTESEDNSQQMIGGSIVGDVLYSIATGEEEGKSRQRILAFAAKRYQNAVEKNPKDHDAFYNWALVLQESADNCSPDDINGRDSLLEEACMKYDHATILKPSLHEAFYNWAIAISDRAKIRGKSEEAQELWKSACQKYEKSVQLNWDAPQALNNWGLALQELSSLVPIKEKKQIVKKSISKFRAAIRLRFDFHRAIYNLGTVLYGLAEDIFKVEKKIEGKKKLSDFFYSQSAIYIVSAHALKPDYPVYRNALRLVRSMLPLPFLKKGVVLIPPNGDNFLPHEEWKKTHIVLSHESLYEAKVSETTFASASPRISESQVLPTDGTDVQKSFRVDLNVLIAVDFCGDLSLPSGGGIVLETVHGQLFMVAEDNESTESWVDAIRLAHTIFFRGKSEVLAGVLVE